MIITVKNLGVIKKAEFDTSKKLTVFCGPNSTGKTYLAYVIYAFYSNKELFDLNSFKEVKKNIKTGNKITIKKKYIEEFLSKITNYCKQKIGEIFGISEESENVFFDNFVIETNIQDKDLIIKDELYHELMKAQNDSIKMKIWWNVALRQTIYGIHAYMLPVERNSIYTFKTELSLSRNQLLDAILEKNAKISKITDLLGGNSRRYPWAIKDSLNTANDLENVKKKNHELYNFAIELEDKLLHGKIAVNQNGDVEYQVKDNLYLPIGISSSIVKTLSSLIIALKYQVDKGNLLIIDEPEMNFHPVNQVILAEILAKISNNTPLLVSTHSDYIIREFNNLIVAKSLQKNGNDTYRQYYDKDSLLDYKDVQVLYFNFDKNEKVNVKSLDVDKYGFAVDSMDETINNQNARMQNLFAQIDD
ncbi:MAG: AAA family ATPase [Bacteroidales bacterium]|nr:AAA family ATPase [Bacteroidales bacterium]